MRDNEKYHAILFHPEGDFVTDFHRGDKQEVWEEISGMGSRWIFYPIPFVATDKTIVDTPEGLEFLKNKKIKTVVNFFKERWENDKDAICDDLNAGIPLALIYPY